VARRYRCNRCQRSLLHTPRCDACEVLDATEMDGLPDPAVTAAELDMVPFPGLDPDAA
jgi:hypothetical protein